MRKLSLCLICLFGIIIFLSLQSCTEATDSLGVDMMPMTDRMEATNTLFHCESRSIAARKVLSRTSVSYLGRFTDPETNSSIKGEFVSQFYNPEVANVFPDSVLDNYITGVDVSLYLSGYIGDTLAPMKVSVYKLDKSLDSSTDYYTDINIQNFLDENATPIVSCVLTIADNKVPSEKNQSSYLGRLHFSLPREYGQEVYDAYKKNKALLANTYSWLNSGLTISRGLFFKLEGGDGAIAYIYNGSLDINFKFHDVDNGVDTLGIVRLSSTEEVIQATHFENSANIDSLEHESNCTYVKSPAGLFTELTLPIDSIEQIANKDSINSASLTLLRMNPKENESFRIGAPKNLLLVRVGDYENRFFESYQVADNKTSFIAAFNAANNTYTFDNIARLIATCIQEKRNMKFSGKKIESVNPNYNKVLLIPVETTYDSSNNMVKLNHDFSISCAKLLGGIGDEKVKISIVHSKFKEE